MQYMDAYSLITSFGDEVMQEGTRSFTDSELSQYGLQQESDGTWTGTTYFADGTCTGLVLGRRLDGTTCPSAACVRVFDSDKEYCRIDWNSEAKKPRDRWVHAHLNDTRHHKYSEDWLEVKDILSELIAGNENE